MPQFLPHQTVIFLGDHTSPDKPGYLRVIRDVLARFHPALNLNLISAGSVGQTAAGLASEQLLHILTSSRPDWVSIAIGLTDAAREPALPALIGGYKARQAESDADEAIGAEYGASRRRSLPPTNGSNPAQSPSALEWQRLSVFNDKLRETARALTEAGARPILNTPIAVGHDLTYPLNLALRAYAKAIRELAESANIPLVDSWRASHDLLDRATTYKQRVALAGWDGQANPQGEALLARAFLNSFGLLPYPGFRPSP